MNHVFTFPWHTRHTMIHELWPTNLWTKNKGLWACFASHTLVFSPSVPLQNQSTWSKIILARDPKQCCGWNSEKDTVSGEHTYESTEESTHMKAYKWEEHTYESTYMRAHIWEHIYESTHMRAQKWEHTYESTKMKARIWEHTHDST